MLTEFGKLLRIIRINNSDSAKTMAKKLGMSPAYLSTIENGKRNIPSQMYDLLCEVYALNDAQASELREAIATSSEAIKLQLSELEEKKKLIIMSLTKGDLDEETVEKLLTVLRERKK